MVGARGFEPPTSWSRTRRSTRLSHAPTETNALRVTHATLICRMRTPLLFLVLAASACADCRFYFADQYDFTANLGFALDVETTSNGSTPCQLSAMKLVLAVADGKQFQYAVVNPAWQTGRVYELRAVVTNSGSQLYVDGQLVGTTEGGFQPLDRAVAAASIPGWASAPAAFVIGQTSLQISDGTSSLSLPAEGSTDIPVPLQLMSPPAAWQGPFKAQNQNPITITVKFRIDPPLNNPHKYDPFVDRYGQTTYSDWSTKTKTDDDLTAAATAERAWLDNHSPIAGLDPFGGSTTAGWQDAATGFYHTVFSNGRWWLITPQGNPGFYLSISDVSHVWQYTPITGRVGMFADLPDRTGALAEAYGTNVWTEGGNTQYFSFQVANMVRKYGNGWKAQADALVPERALKWGFAGVGKWSPRFANVPVMPVLGHYDVPNVVRHPDVFDSKIRARLTDSLAAQINPDLMNPYIVGWSIGNEYDEIITTDETVAMLALGATTPVKIALVDRALAAIYNGDLNALTAAWKIKAPTVNDVYAAKPSVPAKDVEVLRRFFANTYYRTLYQTVKSIDPNHLFLGWWIVPNWWVNAEDWRMQAANTDVVGFDYYVSKFVEPYLDQLIQEAGKPVLIGEFSFPGAYGGWRGFDTTQYSQNMTLSDAESGDRYAQWVTDASAYPSVIGASWFEYRDEPITGRGPGYGPAVVIGEHSAFGLVDTTDRPKIDLIEKALAANITALQSLGLVPAPLTTAPSAIIRRR